jgi:hypothetical protein
MTSRRLVGLSGLALAAVDRSHSRQASLLDPWRLSTPQIHLTKLGFDAGLSILISLGNISISMVHGKCPRLSVPGTASLRHAAACHTSP